MKNFPLFPFLLIILISVQVKNATAQHEYDIWYFGSDAGMDFNSGAPTNLTNGQLYTTEGTAAISDTGGNLLFYTDGVTVYNKLHNVMVNGNGLHGGGSSTQSALILQQPGSNSVYYIFTVGEATLNGLQYSIVDMSLQSGNGEVTLKNISLLNNTTEKLTAALDANNTDYWVVTHEMGNNDFDAFKFSASGINTNPVTSGIGAIHNYEIGYMKCSHNSSKIAVAIHGDVFELFDFDRTTGAVSNNLTLTPPPSAFGPYGVEFSRNDSVLYGTIYSPGIILQWDLSSNINSVIAASQLAIDTSSNQYTTALQLAPDGKIYVAKYGDYSLGVINSPNVIGTGSNYTDNGFDLSPRQSQCGLPNIFPGFFQQTSLTPGAQFTQSDSSFCANTCISFTDQSINNPLSWEWQFPGGNPFSSTDQNPANICYSTPGTYDVILIVTNAVGTDTIVMANIVTVSALPTAVITQSNDTLYASSGTSYQWYTGGSLIPGATNSFYIPPQEEFYTVIITDSNGCSAADTSFFSLAPFSNFSIPDPTICQKFCVDFFDQSGNNPVSWLWQFDGGSPLSSSQQNPANICYNTPGVYDVSLITTNAFGSDTLMMPGYITVYATPPFPTITQVGYTLTSSSASSYQWQLNTVDIAGATNQSYAIMQSGYYTVIISDSNGCVNSSTIYVLISGVDETDDADVSVYPNPSSGNFIVEWPSGLPAGEVSIDVVNILGQKVFPSIEKISLPGEKKEIKLYDEASGVYFLEIKSQNIFLKKKIIITK